MTAWQDDPVGIGALVPSSAKLARAVARQVSAAGTGTIVELGPGSGTITAALLEHGIAPHRLYLVERNPALAGFLRRRFAGVRVVEHDAGRLPALVRRDGIDRVAAIVSSLPLRNLDARARYALLRRSFAVLEPSGVFVQYTYRHSAPLTTAMEERLGVVAECAGYVWSNIPPASIWRLRPAAGRRRAAGEPQLS
jgi:phosphatidylethanolamine/phosphatidyl-N-methylethanolamine N-methyltransferase